MSHIPIKSIKIPFINKNVALVTPNNLKKRKHNQQVDKIEEARFQEDCYRVADTTQKTTTTNQGKAR